MFFLKKYESLDSVFADFLESEGDKKEMRIYQSQIPEKERRGMGVLVHKKLLEFHHCMRFLRGVYDPYFTLTEKGKELLKKINRDVTLNHYFSEIRHTP